MNDSKTQMARGMTITNFIAGLALLISFVNAIINVIFYIKGASISFFPPEQVLLKFEKDRNDPNNDDRRFLRIGARMAYVNTGTRDYNAVVHHEYVSFTLDGKEYIQVWHSEWQFSDPAEDGNLNNKFIAAAAPRPIKAGNSLSREIYFYPKPCFKQPGCNHLFKKEALDVLSKTDKLTFTFKAYLLGKEEPKSASCTIDITKIEINRLTSRGWIVPYCSTNDQAPRQLQLSG